MKNKILKIWGLVMVVAVLAGMLVPAMPVSAANMAWSTVNTPTNTNSVLVPGVNNSWLMDVGPDGKTMAAYDNVAMKFYKSIDGGLSWVTTGMAIGLPASTMVALDISSAYAVDSTIVVASSTTVYRSIDGGVNFGTMPALSSAMTQPTNAVPTPVSAQLLGTITSVKAGPSYLGGQAILVGTTGVGSTGAGTGGAARFSSTTSTWTNLLFNAAGTQIAVDCYAVSFSPNTQLDAEILFVTADNSNVYLETKLGTDVIDADILKATITPANPDPKNLNTSVPGLMATMTFTADYNWSDSSLNRTFVGLGTTVASAGVVGPPSNPVVTNGTGASAGQMTPASSSGFDVWRVSGGFPGGSSRASDLDMGGASSASNISSLSFKGNLADGWLYVGQQNSTTVQRATTAGASTVSFSGAAKKGTGVLNSLVFASPLTGDTSVWEITSGTGVAGSLPSALSASKDGSIYNQVSLINVSAMANVSFLDLAVIDANTVYAIMKDSGLATATTPVGPGAFTLLRTTNAGINWQGVFVVAGTTTGFAAAPGLMNIYPSPAFATDKTVYVTQNDMRIWKTVNAGDTFLGLSSSNSISITAFAPVDANTYFVGGINAIYKSGSFTAATIGGETASSIAYVSPTDMFVGTTIGSVYESLDGGLTFNVVGIVGAMPATAPLGVKVITDIGYATNKIVYAAASSGVYRYTIGSSTSWTPSLSSTINANSMVQSPGPDGTLYLTDAVTGNTSQSGSVWRNVNPASPGPATFEQVSVKLSAFAAVNTSASTVTVKVAATGTAAVPNNTLYVIVNEATGTNPGPYIFTVQDTAVAAPAITAPAADSNVATTVTFSWIPATIPASVVVKYDVQIGYDSLFNAKVLDTTSTGTNAPISGTLFVPASGAGANLPVALIPGTTYYWRTRVSTGSPLQSKWSATTKFNILLTQGTNTLTGIGIYGPLAGATGVSVKPVFQWSAVNGALSYDLQVADNPVFVNPLDAQTGLNTTVWTETKTLDPGKTYYWRVRAVSASNVISDWVAGSFTTALPASVTAPPAVTTTAPPVTVTTTLPPVTTTVTPAAKFFDPNSGLYFNSQSELSAYQVAHPTNAPSPAPATPGYIWVIIVIGAILVIAVIVLIVRTRKV